MPSILKSLVDEIVNNIDKSNPVVIAVCGAADLGKSYLSKQLCNLLMDKDIPASHLTLDSFLIDRELRNNLGISGYNIESYNINEIILSLRQFKNKKEVKIKPYNHSTGRAEREYVVMKPSDILILDGLHSMDKMFNNEIQYSIFIYTDENRLVKIRSEADLNKRNYNEEYAKKISQLELQRYKDNVEIYKQNADVKLFLKYRWNFDIEH